MKQLDHRRRLIDSFVNAIYLFDDYLVITFNYKEGTKTITFAEIEEAFGSDLSANIGTIIICAVLVLIVAAIIFKLVRDKRKGKSSCGCNCAHCAMSGTCHGNIKKDK